MGEDIVDVAGSVLLVEVERLRTRYASLRPGRLQPHGSPPAAELPLRVAEAGDGQYEVLDGHKRLARWQAAGHRHVPVVVEPVSSPVGHKRLILAANAPPRTLTALDEARLVASLVDDDGLSARAVALLCGRKTSWVERRLLLARRLGPQASAAVCDGTIGSSVAEALAQLTHDEQGLVLAVGSHVVS